jgi:hypothetical protein
MGLVAIILANAEDVAPGMWNVGQQADITERNTATLRAQTRPHRIVSYRAIRSSMSAVSIGWTRFRPRPSKPAPAYIVQR